MTLLLVGFARPKASISVKRKQATVVFVLDVSGSMAAADVSPTRLTAAKAAIAQLVARVPKTYRVGLITFSDHAAVVTGPTVLRSPLLAALQRARTGPQGTALTLAIARGVTVADVSPDNGGVRPPAVEIVLSDGGQTARGPTPQQVVTQATKAHVPIDAVAVGTQDGIVRQKIQGGYIQQFNVPVDPTVLRAVAAGTGGHLVTGLDQAFLNNVIKRLNTRIGHDRKSVEVTAVAAGGGMAFMIAGALLGGLWFRRVP
jgi:Ca-activated chloride channel family protein